MASEWEKVKLGNCCLKIGSGATPKGGKEVYLDEGNTFLIRSQNIYNDGFKTEGLVYITDEAAEKLSNVQVKENDILLNITGDSVARVCLAPKKYIPARVNQHVAIIRPNPIDFDARYLRYILTSSQKQALLLNLAAAGATRNALTKNMIEAFEVEKPPLSIQASIANLVTSFDDKIEINRQMNTTLESMAQALFKSWFVNFDPVLDNALAAGNPIPDELQSKASARLALGDARKPLPAESQALFPNAFVLTEEMGWIPEGWEIGNLNKIAKLTTTSVNPSKNSELLWQHYSLPAFDENKQPTIELGKSIKSNKFGVSKNSILLSKLNPHFPRVWRLSDIPEEHAICSTEFMPFASLSPTDLNFIYLLVKSDYFNIEMLNRVTGSTGSHQRVKPSEIAELKIVLPSSLNRNSFDKSVSSLFSTYENNEKNINTLKNLRDTLLPKLLSGELRIPAAESAVAEVL